MMIQPLFLLADDSSTKREFLKRFVDKQLDAEIFMAESTEKAIEIIDTHIEIDAAFIDYEIPSEQGPAIIRHLRKHNPNCLIALVTSADSAAYKADAEAAGADAFICTSWQLKELEDTLNTLLAEWKVQIESR